MVMYRKPVEWSENIVDRRTSARGTAIALAARDAEKRIREQRRREIERFKEQQRRAFIQQQRRGR